VIFPIEDRRGRVVAFGGRTLGDGQPKYLNSPDSALFHKGRLLYNLARARQAVRDGQPLLVVEGYMDVIALAESGIAGAVAPLGTAVTEEQIGELWRLADAPILCLDGDNAGRRAALRAAERALPLLQPGKTLRFAFLPAGEDPDSLVRQAGRAAFDQVLGGARPLAQMVWEKELAEQPADGPEAWAALKGRLLAAAARIQHPEVQRLYRDDLIDRFYAARRQARGLNQGGGQGRGAPGQRRFGPGNGPGRAPAQPRAAKPRAEGLLQRRDTLLLALVINHPPLLAEFLEEMAAVPLAAAHQRLRQGVIDALAGAPDLDSGRLTRHLSSLGLGEALARVLSPAVYAFCAAARPEASLDLARQTLEGLLADVAAGEAARAVDEAERRLAADPSEENLARMAAAVRLMREAEARRGGADTA
jgi:DNA primase